MQYNRVKIISYTTFDELSNGHRFNPINEAF